MACKIRIEYAGAAYHVMARGNQGRDISVPVRATRRYFQGLGDFWNGQAHEIAQFDDFRRRGVLGGQGIEGFMHGQNFILGNGQLDSGFVQFLQRLILAAFQTGLAPGLVNEDAPHGLGGRSEEMGSSMPLLTIRTGQSQPGLMHQRGRLQGLAWRFTGHFLRRELAQFLINQRKQVIRGGGIALRQRFENVRHVAQNEDGYRWRVPPSLFADVPDVPDASDVGFYGASLTSSTGERKAL